MIENYDFIMKCLVWAFPIVLALLIYFKTGSSHIIFIRLWQFFSPQEFKDEKLKKYHEKCMDIYSFRFSNNIKVERLSEVRKLIEWVNKYNLPPKYVAQAGYLIKPNEDVLLKKPSNWWLLVYSLFILALYASAYPSSLLVTKDAALLRVIETNTHYWVTKSKIERLSNNDQFELNKCSDARTDALNTKISIEDINTFCKYYKSNDYNTSISSTIKSQKSIGFILIGLEAIFVLFFIKRIRSLYAVKCILENITNGPYHGEH